jgi:phosphoribosylformylglycinamidine synthase
MDVDVTAVHRREPGMSPLEVMTSESQERMLAIVEPARLAELEEVCRRWEVEARVIGRVGEAGPDGVGRLRIRDGVDGPVLADLPAASLADDAPRYNRPLAPPPERAAWLAAGDPAASTPTRGATEDLLELLLDPSWIYRQYDHQLYLNTVFGPGEADAALLRLAGPGVAFRGKAVAISTDANPGWCRVDPRAGTAATVAESALNVACTGAVPVAVVNCLNFGNPEHPQVMWELSESIDGLAAASLALSLPVIGGNVSLYNESAGTDIEPTPVIAVVGLLEELGRRPPSIVWSSGDHLVLVGPPAAGLGGSRWARQIAGKMGGALPPLDLELHRRLVGLVAALVGAEARAGSVPGLVRAIHDVADGGLAVCLAESALASDVGCQLTSPLGQVGLFSEASSRVVVATARPDDLVRAARAVGIDALDLGTVGGDRLVIPGEIDVALSELRSRFVGRLPTAVGDAVRG